LTIFKISLLVAGLLAVLKLTIAPAVSWWTVALIPLAGLVLSILLVVAFLVMVGLVYRK